ncbi:rhodanese-like domain-containing protein [Patescibacteria group bacterium]
MPKQTLFIIALCVMVSLIVVATGCADTTTETTVETTTTETSLPDTTPTTSPSPVTNGAYQDVTAEEAKELIDTTPDLVILDVSNRYIEGHIPGALNFYVGDGSLDDAIPNLGKDNPYLVYCHVDSASISGSEKLIEAGFSPVYRLEGNYKAWVDAGYEVEP